MKKIMLTILLTLTIWYAGTLNAKSLIINGEINNALALQTISLILYYDTVPEESVITIYIDSCGGDMAAAYMIADTMKACKKPVETIVMGKAYSAAVMIVSIAGTKGLRYGYEHAKYLIHEPYCVLPEKYILHSGDAKRFIEDMDKTKLELIEYIKQNTNIKESDIIKWVNGEYIFNSKTAIKLGVIDQIVNYQNNPNRKYDGKNKGE